MATCMPLHECVCMFVASDTSEDDDNNNNNDKKEETKKKCVIYIQIWKQEFE